MQITVQIHEAWLARPEDLRRVMALLAGLEVPPPSGASPRQTAPAADPEDDEEPFYPEERAPARPPARPDRGDAWEPPAGQDPTDEDAPTDGRQLLGWASKQIPDLKGILIGYGKKKGLRSKIVEWTPQQVAAAYQFARARSTRQVCPPLAPTRSAPGCRPTAATGPAASSSPGGGSS
jgi:hypothetical protein